MKMLKLFLVLTFLCGALYPIGVTLIAQVAFPSQVRGSLLEIDGKLVGSRLIAQKTTGERFFQPRPSAADYATVSSGASQHSPTHKSGNEAREERRKALPAAGADQWTTSGSGLDPHLSPESALAQAPRIAAARGMELERLRALIMSHIESPTLGIWGRPRVNVLELNLALEGQDKDGGHTGTAP